MIHGDLNCLGLMPLHVLVCVYGLCLRVKYANNISGEGYFLTVLLSFSFLTPSFFSTGTHKIVVEKDGKLEFDSGGYHFASSVRSAGNGTGSGGMVRARRLAQEVSSLATSLPLSCSSSVFVRCDKERLDVMKVMTKKL